MIEHKRSFYTGIATLIVFIASLFYASNAHAQIVKASAFGPNLWGNPTACRELIGNTRLLTRRTIGVAHRTLPCNKRVTICYAMRCIYVRVIDRGPFIAGRTFDITEGTTRRVWHLSATQWGVRRTWWAQGWR